MSLDCKKYILETLYNAKRKTGNKHEYIKEMTNLKD